LKTWKSLVMPVEMETFAKAVRSHWLIENQLHWVLDVHFREDQSRARNKHAAQKLATLRRWALNLINADQQKKKRSLKAAKKPPAGTTASSFTSWT
jgi:predicted transposase YbfD/YdcC